jgi:hypothetical protein
VTNVTLKELINRLTDFPKPVITWYGIDRIELSGPVLARWLAKTENLLEAETPFGLVTFALKMPLTWRALPWYTCAQFRGLTLSQTPDLLVTNQPEEDLQRLAPFVPEITVASPVESLAFNWPGTLPYGVLDGAADVIAQPDQLLQGPLGVLPSSPPATGRVLIEGNTASALCTFEAILKQILRGGSVVAIDTDNISEESLRSIKNQEGLTA